MLIEQTFELRGLGLPGRICTPTTGCFHDKTIISKENIRLGFYLLLKYCMRQCTLLPLPVPSHLQNLTPKCKILSLLWTKIASKKRTEEFKFFNWLSNVKNLVLLNGSKYVRNVIQWCENSFFFKKLLKIDQRFLKHSLRWLGARPPDPSL